MNSYFSDNDSLYDIIKKYPQTMDLFINIGFENIKDEEKLKMIGRNISLKMALSMKKINIELFKEQLIQKIEHENLLDEKIKNKEANLSLQGVLPCPVKVPMLESLKLFLNKENIIANCDLRAASMGIGHIKEEFQKNKEVPDLLISAGFDLFFDDMYMKNFKENKVFEDITGLNNLNIDFDNDEISLKDPKKFYSMIAVVPAVFMVNEKELNGRCMPKSWADLLKPEFENSISLPISDLDLFNALLLHIHKSFGYEGIEKLANNFLKNLHPAQMIKSHNDKINRPCVTILPYFFTQMSASKGPLKSVWPEDGAIISPIFMLTKKEKKKELKKIVDFLLDEEISKILSHNGKFPSVSPKIDNQIEQDKKYMWIGWNYIHDNNIAEILKNCEELFKKIAKLD